MYCVCMCVHAYVHVGGNEKITRRTLAWQKVP